MNVNGGYVASIDTYLGVEAGSTGVANISSGTWNNTGSMYVGNSGTGVITINGGLVSIQNGYIGYASSGTASVTSGTWSVGNALYAGASGTGVLNIGGSGVVNVAGGSGYVTLGLNAGSLGTLNFLRPGGTLNAGVVTSGSGTGNL